MTASNPRARHSVLGIVALSLFAALFTRLWYLQVLTTDEYEVLAQANRTRVVIEEAPRGRILDRNKNVLVDNRRTIQVMVDYQDFHAMEAPEQGELLRRLAAELNADQLRIYNGDVPANDPGPAPPDEVVGDECPTEEGEEGTAGEGTTTTSTTEVATGAEDDPTAGEGCETTEEGTGTTTTTTAPGDTEEGTETDDPTDLPLDQRPPPAGVATGAQNPDGQSEAEREPPTPVTEELLRERIEDPRFSKFKPIPVAGDVSEQLEVYLTENAEDFPTVTVERVTSRSYRYGALLAHVLGYTGPINAEDLEAYQNDTKPYENDDQIGKTGIERDMERELRGTPGRRVYEVDARNRPVREIVAERKDPVPGSDVYLTVDINLQFLVEKGLAAEIARQTGKQSRGCPVSLCDPPGGASVVLNPQTGEVLAMASYPTYDPNLFIGGISSRDYLALADPAPEKVDVHHNPLLNRAIAGSYPPGSTYKLFSSYAGLATQRIPSPSWVWNDEGVYKYRDDCPINVDNNCSARNAGGDPMGPVDLTQALARSSDTYFYRLGHVSWRDRESIGGEEAMQRQLRLWGLGQKTGIALPGEAPGRVPDPEWLRDFSNTINAGNPQLAEEAGTWTAGTSGNTMIGQGDVLATPLQLANGYATFANGGTIWKPQLVYQLTPFENNTPYEILTPEEIGKVPFQPGWHEAMLQGFEGVTKLNDYGKGTAADGFDGFDQTTFGVAGKTGTAQTDDENDTSLFAAFAPSRNPMVAMATVVEFAGFGSEAAVPLTRRVMDALASVGGDLSKLNDQYSVYRAPLGGWFDVERAMEEFAPTVVATAD